MKIRLPEDELDQTAATEFTFASSYEVRNRAHHFRDAIPRS
jgi:hypothetical protein